MVRQARQRCESGLYHVVLRGINRGDIFFDREDRLQFLCTLEQKKDNKTFNLLAFCLMSNHVHLLVQETKDPISRIMSRIGTSYAKWYNQKYDRSGHLFQGRYGSECIESEQYLLAVIRYIHNNPIKAKLVTELEAYEWSSIHEYYETRQYQYQVTDTDLILIMFHGNRDKAIRAFREFMKVEDDNEYIDAEFKQKKTDVDVKAEIESLMSGDSIGKLHGLEKEKRETILRTIKMSEGVTLRQIARVTGISLANVYRA